MGMAAKRSSADTDTSQNLCLIPDTDLAKFDSGTENSCQILYQLTEINSSVCCKIKQYFIIIKSIFHINELHFQLVFADLFQTDFKSFFFFLFILLCLSGILLRCHPHDRF